MAGDPTNPALGTFVFDGTEFEVYAVDLAPGECQGMMPTREGFPGVFQELVTLQAEWGARAGIPDGDVTDLVTINARMARIDIFLPALLKAAEILTETRYMLDDKRQRIALNSAQSIDRRAKSSPELFAKYEKTREYRSAIAKKGLKTKERNAEAEDNPDEEQSPPTAPAPK
jgi:hypothetical protein